MRCAASSPLAIQGIKKVLDYCEEHTEEEGLEFVALWNASFFFSQDLEEASRAFMEKRAPRFEGK